MCWVERLRGPEDMAVVAFEKVDVVSDWVLVSNIVLVSVMVAIVMLSVTGDKDRYGRDVLVM